MEGRRTRGRPPVNDVRAGGTSGASKRGSSNTQTGTGGTVHIVPMTVQPRGTPPRGKRASPVRRSSRPRSTTLGASASTATIIIAPSPIPEAKEPAALPKQQRALSGRNDTTTNANKISTKFTADGKTISTTSVHSSYSTTTQKTVEIRSSDVVGNTNGADAASELNKLGDYLRRSVSRTITAVRAGTHTPTNTETESRYSRSVSRSLYEEDRYSKTEFSDDEQNDDDYDDDEVGAEHYKSFSQITVPARTGSSPALFCRKLASPQEYGGRWGVLALLLLTPCLVYYLQWSCSRPGGGCALRALNLRGVIEPNYLLKSVFSSKAVGAYVSFTLGIAVLSALLPGKQVRLPLERGGLTYRFNAPAMVVLLSAALGVAIYLGYPVVDFVLRHYLRFCIYGFVNAVIVSQWSYLFAGGLLARRRQPTHSGVTDAYDKETLVNEYGKTGQYIVDFAQGRQVNPKWLGFIECKLVSQRVALLGALLIAQCFIYKTLIVPAAPGALLTAAGNDSLLPAPNSVWAVALHSAERAWQLAQHYATKTQYDQATLLSAGLLLFYSADALVFEHHLAFSFELQAEGYGCLLLQRYAATPFLLSAVVRHLSIQQPTAIVCPWSAFGAIALLMVGLTLKRFSNAIKYQYRLNPTQPIFCGMDSIHTFQGRRLLLGSLWGRLRQPNYAGDILALLALAMPLALRFAWPPLLSVLLLVVLLLHRTARVNARNLARYHSSWVRYCTEVRYYLLPKVY